MIIIKSAIWYTAIRLSELLALSQLGVGITGGAEAAVHGIHAIG